MTRIRCFLLVPTGRVAIYARRYAQGSCASGEYHNAKTRLEDEPVEYDERGYVNNRTKPTLDHKDSRWPTQCPCGYAFQENDEWQRFSEVLYQRDDTKEETTIGSAPVGAMWDAWWLDQFHVPQGVHNLCVKTPGGEWNIDSQCSNCTMPDDTKQERHHCWIRHGNPPNVTVDKQGAQTCQAGAGSIQANHWHGFLRGGWLED